MSSTSSLNWHGATLRVIKAVIFKAIGLDESVADHSPLCDLIKKLNKYILKVGSVVHSALTPVFCIYYFKMGSTEQLPKMQYRFLGRSGLQVSVISLGGWVTYGGHVGDQIAFDCMKAAYDVGINFFDCAEGYAEGKSEEVMGQAIKKFGWKRNDLVISTKIYWGSAFGENIHMELH